MRGRREHRHPTRSFMQPLTRFVVETDWFSKPVSVTQECSCSVSIVCLKFLSPRYLASSTVNSLYFDQAIKSAISTRKDQKIKEITSFQKELLLAFVIENAIYTFACLLTGYGKSLIFQLAVRVAAEFQF